ncbi:MAG: helix-turn-helix domain-containing protein [Clostridia bacterium]|nr:helix-turn-helix domain-containing protein [Clostridia bacterium]
MKKQSLKKYFSKDIPMKYGSYVSVREVEEPTSLHWHDFLEIEMVVDGNGSQLLNGQKTNLSRGSISVLRHTDYHQIIPEADIKIINLSLSDRVLSDNTLSVIFSLPQVPFFQIPAEDFKILEDISLLCVNENEKIPPNRNYLNGLLECFFLKLFEITKTEYKAGDESSASLSPINAALRYLHANFRKNPSLKDVAKIAHYNTSHFSTAFHSEVGVPYITYLTNLKINYAKELLACTNLKITEICFECGFASHPAFLRAFNAIVGCSPQVFRRNINPKS